MNSMYEGMDYEDRITACEECLEDNKLLIFFFLIGFLPGTAFLASWIVGIFVHNNEPEEEIVDTYNDNEDEEDVPYENEYSLDNVKNDNEDLDFNLCYITEITPDGSVFLRYNDADECYDFWSDKKVISYKYLETAARKFVTTFRCTNIYINREKDIKDQIQEEKELEEQKKMKKEDKESDSDDDVFAKLKPKPQLICKNTKMKSARIANRYRHQGKEDIFINLMKKSKSKSKTKDIGFADWKHISQY